MGNVGLDITPEELAKQHSEAIRIIVELRERAEAAECKAARWKELYESAITLVRRYQAERERFLARVEGALLGIASASKD
jgi:hypothetical protein